jgi:hypothetical protein
MKRPDRTGIDYLLHAIIAIRWNKLSITWNIRVMGFANKCKLRKRFYDDKESNY